MDAEFYYKETFPLELRISVKNTDELRLLEAIFFNLADSGAANWKNYGDRYAQIDSRNFNDNNFPREEFWKVHEMLAERRKEHESRDVLQGNMAEGTKDSDSK